MDGKIERENRSKLIKVGTRKLEMSIQTISDLYSDWMKNVDIFTGDLSAGCTNCINSALF